MTTTTSTAHEITAEDFARMKAIQSEIPGWSDLKQYAFFKAILEMHPDIQDVLILGVYHGRDIAFLLDVAARYHPSRVLRVVGVDKFSSSPCDDWPVAKRGMSWEQAGFGPPPDYGKALHNVMQYDGGPRMVALVQQDDAKFLAETKLIFDFVYCDTSHDLATVARQLSQLPAVCRESTLIAGDDYSDEGTWGVKRAVSAAFNRHEVFANWIWYSNRKELKA